MYNMCNYLQKCENDVRLKLEVKFFISSFFWPFWPFSQIFSFIHLHLMSHSNRIQADLCPCHASFEGDLLFLYCIAFFA